MDTHEFDRLTRVVAQRLPRRRLAGLLGLSSLSMVALGEAKKNKKKKKKKVKRNDFDCVNVGKFCKKDDQCCSGICEGKKDKKKCKAHDESTCQSGQDTCLGVTVQCTTATGEPGVCAVTTGKASYCFATGTCIPCQKDSDCEPSLGAGAACIVCDDCLEENFTVTGCVGPTALM